MRKSAVEIDLRIRLFAMRRRIKNLAPNLKTGCAKRHRVFLNPHFWGNGFGAKSADITAFSGFSSPIPFLMNVNLGENNMDLGIFKRIWGIFGQIWEVLKARKRRFSE